jgi:hypothetical protein
VKLWHAIAGVGVLLAGGIYAYQHQAELGLAMSLTPDALEPAHLHWQKVDHTEDGFKVELPDTEKQSQIDAQNAVGSTEPINMISAEPDTNTKFSVSWADDPPVARASRMDPNLTMDAARDAALERTKSTLAAEKRLSYQGAPARDFSGRNADGGVFSARLIFSGRRLYMLMASFPAAGARRDKDVTRFFNSFAMVNNGR